MKTKMRLTQKEIKKITEMAKENRSLNEISNILNIKKTTAYYWFVKAVGKKINPVEIDRSDEFAIGQFMGAFSGDGNFYFDRKSYHYRISFVTSLYEKMYAAELQNLIRQIFGKESAMYELENKILLVVYGKDILELIKEHLRWHGKKGSSVRLRHNLSFYSTDFLRGFVRGLFDTDGNVSKKKAQIMLGSISRRIILQVSDILKMLDLEHSFYKFRPRPNRREFNCIYLYNKENLYKFNKIIGFTNPVKGQLIKSVMRQ